VVVKKPAKCAKGRRRVRGKCAKLKAKRGKAKEKHAKQTGRAKQ
jgi:hypothetical protein